MRKKLVAVFVLLLVSCLVFSLQPTIAQEKYPVEEDKIYLKTFSKDGTTLKIEDIDIADAVTSFQDTGEFWQFNKTLTRYTGQNVFIFPLETKGLDFYYQPPLNAELDLKQYSFVNETHALNAKGEVVAYRPPNIVGSWVAYRSDGKTGNQYTTSKVYHLYTPLIIDAKGDSVYAQLQVSKDAYTVSISSEWLEKASYPVVIDPSFGRTDVGGSSAVPTAKRIYSYPFNLTEDGTITSMSAYLRYNTPGDLILGIYDGNGSDPVNLEGKTSAFACPNVTDWVTQSFASSFELTADEYWLALIADGSSFYIYYDSTGTRKTRDYGVFDLPDPFGTASSGTQTASIFANYTVAAGDSTAPTYSDDLSTSTTVAGASCDFNATFNDETALEANGQYQFGINQSGSWVWDSAVNFSSTSETVSVSKTLTNTYGLVIGYQWNFTDNAGNSNTTGTQTLTTTADSYTVTLSTVNPAPALGETITVDIAVSREAGVTVSSWQANITKTGADWGVNYAESSFTVSEDSATTHVFDVTSLYDVDCGATVTPTCADLSVTWSLGGGGGSSATDSSGEPEPTATPDGGDDGGEFELPNLTEDDYTNFAVGAIIIGGGFVGALVIVKRKPSRKAPRKQKSPLGRKKVERKPLL